MSSTGDADPGNLAIDEASAALLVTSRVIAARDLEAAIGLAPDRSWQRGAVASTNNPPGWRHEFSGVRYDSRLPPSAPPHAHLDDLLDRLAPHREQIIALAQAWQSGLGSGTGDDLVSLRLWVFLTTSEQSLGVDFSPAQLASVLDLGAYLGVSVYVICDDGSS